MLPISPDLAELLALSQFNAIAEIVVQGPNPSNSLQAGAQLILDGVTQVTVTRNEETSSDTINYQIANTDYRYSPVKPSVTYLPAVNLETWMPDAINIGNVNWKTICYIGLTNIIGDAMVSSIVPQGTYVLSSTSGNNSYASLTQTVQGYDLSHTFNFNVSANLPHTLFGNQTDPRYDPYYNLQNPSADLKTYVCDAKNFMTQVSDNQFLAADFVLIFGTTASPDSVNVYVGTPTVAATTPVSASTYTWNPVTGTVTFSAAQAADAVISIDGVPQSMSPELMLSHLFYDYAHYDPAYFEFNTTNVQLPMYTGSTDTVWDIAQNIAGMTGPRGVVWRLRMDEYGYILFYEDKYSDTPTETLVDEEDFIQLQYTYTDEQLQNVVSATAYSNTQQPVTSISYDLDSINEFGQRTTYNVNSTLLLSLKGSPSLFVNSMLNMMTASQLTTQSKPIVQLTVTVPPNPSRQCGDKITVIERSNGLSGPYIIKGITRTVQTGALTEQLRLQNAVLYANYNIGLPIAVTAAPAPGTISSPQSTVAASGATAEVITSSVIVTSVTIGGTQVIKNGAIVKNANGVPLIPYITGPSWSFSFNIPPANNYDTVLWQMVYFECPNTLTPTDIMVMRAGTWVSNDGTVIPGTTIGSGSGYTETYTHTTGSQLGGSETAYLYGDLVYLAHQNILPPGYASSMGTLTYLAATGLSGSIGFGYGQSYTGNYAWLPNNKINYGYYVIFAANASGASQLLRIPFTWNC
jgi:hypothetical protein